MADYFLMIDGIPGEVTDAQHRGWIQLESFSWGLSDPGTGAGAGAGRAKFRDFQFTMAVNKASPLLFLSCANGKHIKEAMLNVRKSASLPVEYLQIKFSELMITSFEETAGVDPPQDTVGFSFERIEMTYTPEDASGNPGTPVTAGWDLPKDARI